MLYTMKDGKKTDGQIHYALVSRQQRKTLVRQNSLNRLVSLGMPKDDAKKALKD